MVLPFFFYQKYFAYITLYVNISIWESLLRLKVERAQANLHS